MIKFVKDSAQIARSVLYSSESLCVLCAAKHGPICPDCIEDFLHPELGRCLRCGKLITQDKTLCLDCKSGKGPKHLDQVIAWGHYSGHLKELIQNVKFGSNPLRIRKIAQPLVNWAIKWLPPVDGVLAIPMHSTRLAERGFNQADVIASLFHWELGLPILQGIKRVKATPPQVSLSRQERLLNLKNAFEVQDPSLFHGKSVWLIDDVTTTGSTLDSVAEVLRGIGTKPIYGVCLAAGIEKGLVPSSD
jgi:competence protein ComFC